VKDEQYGGVVAFNLFPRKARANETTYLYFKMNQDYCHPNLSKEESILE
jgi:hypothetical protein